jgi:predicted secreted protein
VNRHLLLLVVSATLVMSPFSTAGDIAELSVLGFTHDGSVFVFETFGEYDAIDGGFSNLFFVETRNGNSLPDTPISVFCRGGTPQVSGSPGTSCDPIPTVAELRREMMSRAAPRLAKLGDLDPGVLLYSNSEAIWHRRYTASFVHRLALGDRNRALYRKPQVHELQISALTLPSNCNMGRRESKGSKGILLRLNRSVVYQDKSLPRSRACAKDYAISEIRWRARTSLHIAIMSVLEPGFETDSRTFVAIPFLLSP